jgi:hypothetical protein
MRVYRFTCVHVRNLFQTVHIAWLLTFMSACMHEHDKGTFNTLIQSMRIYIHTHMHACIRTQERAAINAYLLNELPVTADALHWASMLGLPVPNSAPPDDRFRLRGRIQRGDALDIVDVGHFVRGSFRCSGYCNESLSFCFIFLKSKKCSFPSFFYAGPYGHTLSISELVRDCRCSSLVP